MKRDWSTTAPKSTVCSHLPALLWLPVPVRRQQRAEAQQREVHGRAALLNLGPVLPKAPDRWGWRGQVRVSWGGVDVIVMVVVVVVEVRRRHAAVAVAANQEGPPVVTVVQQGGRRQQHQDEGAEQEEKHVDAFTLSRQA